MTEHFADHLSCLIEERGPICAGLDPRADQMPEDTAPIEWGRKVIDTLRDRVPVFKPQIAFWGDSWWNLGALVSQGKTGDAMVLVDCKRGDIGSTAKAYADSIFARPWVDAITVNPYLGEDSLQPFVDAAEEHDRGIFVLVRTSNPGAKVTQAYGLSDRVAGMVYKLGNRLPKSQSGRTRVGAVIGLTVDCGEVTALRKIMPDSFFLMPGYGAQGGDSSAYVRARDARGGGVLVNASRSLTLPWGKDPAPKLWQRRIEIEFEIMQRDLKGAK